MGLPAVRTMLVNANRVTSSTEQRDPPPPAGRHAACSRCAGSPSPFPAWSPTITSTSTPRRRGPGAARRKRRWQVDADERPVRADAPDEGEVLLDGQPLRLDSPRRPSCTASVWCTSTSCWCPPLSVAENLMLGSESTAGPGPGPARRARRVRELSSSYGSVDPDALVRDLPVGAQQRVEILKALYREARVLILDEPTAVLTPQEARDLFRVMRTLAGERQRHHLHHAQAARGVRSRRSRHRPEAGQGRGLGPAA